jgi:Domain of Unknown Function (DUF1080)
MTAHDNRRGFRFALSTLLPSLRGGMSMLAVALMLGIGAGKAQAATVIGPDDFEGGSSANWTPNNDTSNWSVDSTTEVGNKFFTRVSSSTSWADAPGAGVYGDVSVEAMVRVHSWNASTQNRVYVFARYSGSTPGAASAYQVSIAPDSTIAIERRDANKVITTLATGHFMDVVGQKWNEGAWNMIRLEVSGTSPVLLSAYVNGVQIATATDSIGVTGTGAVGFGSAGASADFDDITVGDSASFSGPESGVFASLSDAADRPMVCALVPSSTVEKGL